MIDGTKFVAAAAALDFSLCTSVPCSLLTPLVNAMVDGVQVRHVGATNEGEALAVASGAVLGGGRSMVLMQNSGLGNAVNPLLSLNAVFKIPVLLVISWRGHPEEDDEPQHELSGKVLLELLTLLGVAYERFPDNEQDIEPKLSAAVSYMTRTSLPFALIVRDGDIAPEKLLHLAENRVGSVPEMLACSERRYPVSTNALTRWNAIKAIGLGIGPDVALVATTGKTGRELFASGDNARNFYMLGSMGCSSSIALGISLAIGAKCVVLDGDGALLMKMGSLATIGICKPDRFVHVLLDNGVHDSTGGQPTNGSAVDFEMLARATGYSRTVICLTERDLETAVKRCVQSAGPSFVYVRISPGSISPLPRPNVSPVEIARRFSAFLLKC